MQQLAQQGRGSDALSAALPQQQPNQTGAHMQVVGKLAKLTITHPVEGVGDESLAPAEA
jgi:hypothetical protein